MADLDGDGFEDIVSVHEADIVYDGKPIGFVRIAWGTDDPDTWDLTTLSFGPEAAAAEDVSIVDANGDGHPDVIVATELAHLVYFENPGIDARHVRWRRTIPPITTNRGSFIRVFFADFDGDGRPEVVAANKGDQDPPEIVTKGNDGQSATTTIRKKVEKKSISLFVLPENPLNGVSQSDACPEPAGAQRLVPCPREPSKRLASPVVLEEPRMLRQFQDPSPREVKTALGARAVEWTTIRPACLDAGQVVPAPRTGQRHP